ncbi:MAG: histidinol phosphate phosphatase domain-containing protein, partial [Bacilli bacterium]
MRVDYHVHLEEGPYTQRWLERTSKALFSNHVEAYGSRPTIVRHIEQLLAQARNGAYNENYLDLYLQQAVKNDIKHVGIVDHLYRFKETRSYFERYMNVSHDTL